MTTVLIVDDRRESHLVASKLLEELGYRVISIADANGAMECVRDCQVDVVIMDMNMPDMDGCEATEILKGCPETASIPVIICTAHPTAGDAERAAACGADLFLEKPLRLDEIRQGLQHLLHASALPGESPIANSSAETGEAAEHADNLLPRPAVDEAA